MEHPHARQDVTIRIAVREAEMATVRVLFQEYADGLGVDLSFQGFAQELAGLPGDYVPPRGALLVAWDGDAAVGCVALRAIEWPQVAELKRLYVSPRGRGSGLGERLTREVMVAAGRAGYQRLRLDTLPDMTRAQRLYERLGFRDIDAYRFNPVPGTRYMECTLGPHA